MRSNIKSDVWKKRSNPPNKPDRLIKFGGLSITVHGAEESFRAENMQQCSRRVCAVHTCLPALSNYIFKQSIYTFVIAYTWEHQSYSGMNTEPSTLFEAKHLK